MIALRPVGDSLGSSAGSSALAPRIPLGWLNKQGAILAGAHARADLSANHAMAMQGRSIHDSIDRARFDRPEGSRAPSAATCIA